MGYSLERPNNRLERGQEVHEGTLRLDSPKMGLQNQQLNTLNLLSKSRLLLEERLAEPKLVVKSMTSMSPGPDRWARWAQFSVSRFVQELVSSTLPCPTCALYLLVLQDPVSCL